MTHPADKAMGDYYARVPTLRTAVTDATFRAGYEACQRDIGSGIPSVSDVAAYCKERGNSVNPLMWHDHYTANGWMVGRSKMKDWKAAVRTWEYNRTDLHPKQGQFAEMRSLNRG